ncbi:MAG: DUF2304 domain-containing protein [Eubacteriales bacterium]|nr:DUF2304 domain-containing protein [Eubacteriales bacterium]
MNTSLRGAIVIALIIYYVVLLYLLRKRALILKYTLLWLTAGVIMILIVIFPQAFEKVIHSIGIIEMTNGLFAVTLFAIMIIVVSITSIVSKMNERIRQLVQECAMYEKRLRELERKFTNDESN